jgi:hypothetical protein
MTKKTDDNLISRAEFSRLLGVSRAAVTNYAHAGKIVCDNSGKVFIKQSLTMLEQTSDPAQQHVVERWQQHRAAKQQATQPPPEPTPIDSWKVYSERLENGIMDFIKSVCNRDAMTLDAIKRGNAEQIEDIFYRHFPE